MNILCTSRQTSDDGQKGWFQPRRLFRRKRSCSLPNPQELRRRARSYEDVFRRETSFLRKSLRTPCVLGEELLTRRCISFDDLTRIEQRGALDEKSQELLEVIDRKHCFDEFYRLLCEQNSPVVDYLEIKRHSKKYVSDADFVKKLGYKAFLTANDSAVLKRLYSTIVRNTSSTLFLFTQLRQSEVLDDDTFETLMNKKDKEGETACMKYFMQNCVSRFNYAEMRRFCEALSEDNSHVAEALWPIVCTVDPGAAAFMENASVLELDIDISLDEALSKRAYDILQSSVSSNQISQASVALGNHGAITKVSKGSSPASIVVTFSARTQCCLGELRKDVEYGRLRNRIQMWLESSNKKGFSGLVVKATMEDDIFTRADRALNDYFGRFLSKGRLDSSVQFGFCKEQGEWFWSHDGTTWSHVTRLRVPTGVDTEKVPTEKDIQVIQMLARQQIPLQRPVSPCPVCTMGSMSVQEPNIYGPLKQCESLHPGVQVAVVFTLYHKHSDIPDGAKNRESAYSKHSPVEARSSSQSPRHSRLSILNFLRPGRHNRKKHSKHTSRDGNELTNKRSSRSLENRLDTLGKEIADNVDGDDALRTRAQSDARDYARRARNRVTTQNKCVSDIYDTTTVLTGAQKALQVSHLGQSSGSSDIDNQDQMNTNSNNKSQPPLALFDSSLDTSFSDTYSLGAVRSRHSSEQEVNGGTGKPVVWQCQDIVQDPAKQDNTKNFRLSKEATI